MFHRIPLLTFVAAGMLLAPKGADAAQITAERSERGVVVKIDGQLFTEYLTRSGTKPILWPIIGPTGKLMTRSWPMGKKGPHERADHIHQRSFWFSHGDVNGVNFWTEHSQKKGDKAPKPAIVKHREFVKVESGKQAVIVSCNDWLDPDGKKVCEDERTLTFGTDGRSRWIDFDIEIKAIGHPVTFGDTKEGCFGIRMAATMKPDAKLGGKLVNSEGQTGKAAWGKQAAWVDYSGPVEGQTLGIAMFNHPSSFRFPTHWHARSYGLCSANPFGLSYFEGKGANGSHTISAGQSITLRYRVLLHKGDSKEGKVAEAFAAYAKQTK
jgi:hypothetical protein